ncbi:MAG: hypothetical protein Q8P61_08320, partial [Candidatus Nanopelagicales bacterium]|nr:hypothetical protein [Candidatus Nanopelagicales bacterium]
GLAFPKENWQDRLAVANSNSGLAVINLESGETTEQGSIGTPEKSPTQAAFTPDGKRLYLTNTGFGQPTPSTTISFFRVGEAD